MFLPVFYSDTQAGLCQLSIMLWDPELRYKEQVHQGFRASTRAASNHCQTWWVTSFCVLSLRSFFFLDMSARLKRGTFYPFKVTFAVVECHLLRALQDINIAAIKKKWKQNIFTSDCKKKKKADTGDSFRSLLNKHRLLHITLISSRSKWIYLLFDVQVWMNLDFVPRERASCKTECININLWCTAVM